MNSLVPRITPVVRVAARTWLTTLVVDGGIHWRTPEEASDLTVVLPVVLLQLTSPGTAVPRIGSTGWTGELMLRVIAPHLATAEQLVAQACALIPVRYVPPADSDLVLTAELARPMLSQVGQINAQAGVYVRLTIDTL
jgi:hypothetical protein